MYWKCSAFTRRPFSLSFALHALITSRYKLKTALSKKLYSLYTIVLLGCGDVYAWGNSEYSQVGFATDKTLVRLD